MNPLDNEEFSKLLQTIKQDMPLHTNASFSIKKTQYGRFPKSIQEYSAKINNEFLNSNLAIIEEINHKDSKHWIPKWFQEYQNRIYGDSDILNHDNFFKAKLHDSFFKFGYDYNGLPKNTRYGNHGNAFISFGSLNGPDLEAYPGGSASDTAGAIVGSPVNGTIGKLYDRIAENVNTAVGNERLGAYDGTGSDATDLLAETGSVACTVGFNWRSVTEFALGTATTWIVVQNNNAGNLVFRTSSVSRLALTQAFGAFPNPITTESIGTGTGNNLKIGHS